MKPAEQLEYRNSVAETFASLCLGLWTVALVGYLSSGISWHTYFLVIVGVMSALFGIYLVFPPNWKQKQVLEYLKTHRIIKNIKFLVWLVVILIFGLNLVQTKVGWLVVTGLVTMIIALAVFYVALFRIGKNKKKGKYVRSTSLSR